MEMVMDETITTPSITPLRQKKRKSKKEGNLPKKVSKNSDAEVTSGVILCPEVTDTKNLENTDLNDSNPEKKECPNIRSRKWCVTINNPTEDDWNQMHSIDCEYKVYAPEVGEKGTPHIQGYLHFQNDRWMKALKKRLPRAKLIVARGDAYHNRDYIIGPYERDGKYKEYNPAAIEVGTCPEQGARNDLKAVAARIMNDPVPNPIRDVENHSVMARYGHFVRELRSEYLSQRAFDDWASGWKPEVIVRWSRFSGIGKTRHTFNAAREKGVRVCEAQIKKDGYGYKCWFHDYNPGDIILFDEFVGQMDFEWCKKFFDRYPIQMEYKGGFITRVASDIHITSNRHPEEWWPGMCTTNEWGAMLRRLTIIEVDENGNDIICPQGSSE